MDESLLAAFRATRYLVCLDPVEWADIRIDQPLPVALHALVGAQAWGFITAWNPRGEPRDLADNLAAQGQLFAALREWPNGYEKQNSGTKPRWRARGDPAVRHDRESSDIAG